MQPKFGDFLKRQKFTVLQEAIGDQKATQNNFNDGELGRTDKQSDTLSLFNTG